MQGEESKGPCPSPTVGTVGGMEVVEKSARFQLLEVEQFLVITRSSVLVAEVEQI